MGTTGSARRTARVDDWAARPSAARPRPVVLIHGTNDTSAIFTELGRELAGAGHVVFTADYGRDDTSLRGRGGAGGIADVAESARQIARFVHRVREATGAEQVDLVGHSQGGLHAHAFVKGGGELFWAGAAFPGARYVGTVVTLGSTLHGASPLGPLDPLLHLPTVGRAVDRLLGHSARQQVRGSDVIAWLGRTADAAPGVSYTSIVSRWDTTVRPLAAQHLEPGPGVRNVYVQDVYPGSRVSHAQMPRDPQTIALVRRALTSGPPAARHVPKAQRRKGSPSWSRHDSTRAIAPALR